MVLGATYPIHINAILYIFTENEIFNQVNLCSIMFERPNQLLKLNSNTIVEVIALRESKE